jgi:hypothetical protein
MDQREEFGWKKRRFFSFAHQRVGRKERIG